LDDIVNTTSEVFLGLTIGCARCHNHKFEPLTMHDYYRMVAIFEPLQRPVDGRAERTLPIGTPREVAAARQRHAAEIAALQRKLDELKQKRAKARAESKAGKSSPQGRDDRGNESSEIAALEKSLEESRRKPVDLPEGYFLSEPSSKLPVS